MVESKLQVDNIGKRLKISINALLAGTAVHDQGKHFLEGK